MLRRGLRWSAGAVSLALGAVLLVVVLPRLTGSGWDATSDRVEGIPLPQVWQIVAVWAAGLWMHTFVLQASLPGLSKRRAFALNLGGSSVSNVLPFGGAAGVGLNYAMLRSWGYDKAQITAFAAVSNLVVALAKAGIALTGLVALATMPGLSGALPWHPGDRSTTVFVAAMLVLLASTALALRGRQRRLHVVGDALRGVWRHAAAAVRRGWHLLTIGGIGYPALQALLLWLCLSAVGAGATMVAVLVTYAVERLVTLIPLTPGGVGIVETAAVATLVGFGADPAAAAAGVILFRVFSFLIEIPLGGLITMAWFAGRRRRSTATAG